LVKQKELKLMAKKTSMQKAFDEATQLTKQLYCQVEYLQNYSYLRRVSQKYIDGDHHKPKRKIRIEYKVGDTNFYEKDDPMLSWLLDNGIVKISSEFFNSVHGAIRPLNLPSIKAKLTDKKVKKNDNLHSKKSKKLNSSNS